jgi:RecA-family ATPase
MQDPQDGEEIFRAMAEVNRRYREDPQLHADVIELLAEQDKQRDAEAEPASVAEPAAPEARQPEEPEAREQQPREEQPQRPQQPQLKLVRRMGKELPPPVAFAVDGLFHEVGTGMICGKYFSGKTYVAMSLTASVATGKPFAGRAVLRKGAVLWLAAEGAWEVDKRIRAAVAALGGDPDNQPVYVQRASVPKLLSGGEQAVMDIVREAEVAAKAEFGVPLALVVIDTMIKAAGYKKSENDAVEVNNTIQVMDNISWRAKCFVLALDHMGKDEDRGARGSSDKPSSVDVYAEIKSNGGRTRTLHVVKVKGEKGDDEIDFETVAAKLEDGQKTACIKWSSQWKKPEEGTVALNALAKLLLKCAADVIASEGQEKMFFVGEPRRNSAQKKAIYKEFSKKHVGSERHDMAFKRAWKELVDAGLVTTVKDENSSGDMDQWVYLERV